MSTQEPAVALSNGPGAFRLADASDAASIHRVGGESVVAIAARDLRNDVERVCGRAPALEEGIPDAGERAVVVGTYGASADLDRVVDERITDHGLESAPERFALAVLEDVLGLERALLIVGSDPRGTAYGAYEVAERIGVSPWYWWADVPPETREEVRLSSGVDLEGPPSVRYRGIFLNDEDFGLRPWATETYEPESPDGIGPKTYERVFELLLRLKGNTVWPAMHGGGKAFYQVEGNREAADRYGILVGTSHCEPMHRNNVEEWVAEERGEWNYETNAEAVREYWRERLEEVAAHENIFTTGMRGIHDSGMPGGETLEERVDLLQTVLDDQRELLAEILDPDVESIPQIFCPYKEVLDLYRGGLEVPEDVTVVWPNDNFGYVRELPTAEEREREGGHGIYYHLSYWGRPHDHQWLCSTPPAFVREELRRAYAHGARELWIANVGDLKPAEKETEYFFDLAWDVEGVGDEPVADWLERWAAREFDPERAGEIAETLREYYRLGLARKPEHVGWNTVYPNTAQGEPQFSAVAEGDEARRRLEAYRNLDRRAEAIADDLPMAQRDAFFHLVEYPVRGAHLRNRATLDAMRSRLYAGQGRASAGEYADRALEAHEGVRTATERYNESAGGKWRKMMSERPRDLPAFDPPAVARLEPGGGRGDGGVGRDGDGRPALGVAVEGEPTVAGTTSGVAGVSDGRVEFELPELVAGVDRPRFVDVFDRGNGDLEWTATADEDWLILRERGDVFGRGEGGETDFVSGDYHECGGTLEAEGDRERRIWASVDWDAAPDEPTVGELRIEGAGRAVGVAVPIRPRADAAGDEGGADRPVARAVDGRVAIEAERPTATAEGSADLAWEPVDGLSRTSGAAMAVRPLDGPRLEADDDLADRAPRLEYAFEWPYAGEATLEVQLRPTHAPDDEPLRFAVGVAGGAPRLVTFGDVDGEHDPAWQRNVLRGTEIAETIIGLEPGRCSIAIYGVDPGVVLDRVIVRADGDRRSYLGPRETRAGGPRVQPR